ncbi:hypothetical protein ACISMR_04635 [Campylobacter jejuni]
MLCFCFFFFQAEAAIHVSCLSGGLEVVNKGKFHYLSFYSKNLDLEIQNLILEKNKQNISLQGNLNINNSYQAKLQVISSDEPDEIFPWTKDYGGLNQYFLKENNNFFINLSYDSLANPQLKINGSEFSNMDLN